MSKIIDWDKVETLADLKAVVLLDMFHQANLFKNKTRVVVRTPKIGSRDDAIKAVEHLFVREVKDDPTNSRGR